MKVGTTPEAEEVLRRAGRERRGSLTITIGTGCCESTAPFLYEDFYPGSDQEKVGEAVGVAIYAPEYLRELYPGDDGVVIDVVHTHAESFSIETEWGCRLILRGSETQTSPCEVARPKLDLADPDRPGARVRGELPEALQRLAGLR